MTDKALLVGINEYASPRISDLKGCVNDIKAIKKTCRKLGFEYENEFYRVLEDEKATLDNIRAGWDWLLEDAKPGERRLFHFSGHGSQVLDTDGDEITDRLDECLCLHDMDWTPDTCITDDTLNEWLQEVPKGVLMTVVLDCCHSATGTRFMPVAGNPNQSLRMVDVETNAKAGVRTIDSFAGTFLAEPERAPMPRFAFPPDEVLIQAKSVRGRFLDTLRFGVRGRSVSSESTDSDASSMNHVLWAACRADQTAADAYIDGRYQGAFSHALTEAIEQLGQTAKSTAVKQRLDEIIVDGGYPQRPTLEPKDISATIFYTPADRDDDETDDTPVDSEEGPSLDEPSATDTSSSPGGDFGSEGFPGNGPFPMGGLNDGDPASMATLFGQFLAWYQGLGNISRGSGPVGMVTCHGICKPEDDYGERWRDNMEPYLPTPTMKSLRDNFGQVMWNDLVSKASRSLETPTERVASDELRDQIVLLLQDRILQTQIDAMAQAQAATSYAARTPVVPDPYATRSPLVPDPVKATPRGGQATSASGIYVPDPYSVRGQPGSIPGIYVPDPYSASGSPVNDRFISPDGRSLDLGGPASRSMQPPGTTSRAMLGIPGLDCIDDFVKYLRDASIRAAIQGRFRDKLGPLLHRGCEVFMFAHSWGSVVAYDTLCQMSPGQYRGRVARLFTIGSPLSMWLIARATKSRPAARPLNGSRPSIVRAWTNLNARGDKVGGALSEFRPDEELLGLDPVNCDPGWFGMVSPACAHSSYFDKDNAAVANDIFARLIQS